MRGGSSRKNAYSNTNTPIRGLRNGGGPYQPHPGAQRHRCRCSLPGLTGFTVGRRGGTGTNHHCLMRPVFYSCFPLGPSTHLGMVRPHTHCKARSPFAEPHQPTRGRHPLKERVGLLLGAARQRCLAPLARDSARTKPGRGSNTCRNSPYGFRAHPLFSRCTPPLQDSPTLT